MPCLAVGQVLGDPSVRWPNLSQEADTLCNHRNKVGIGRMVVADVAC